MELVVTGLLFDNTERVAENALRGVPGIPKGKQVRQFKEGELLTFTDTAPYRGQCKVVSGSYKQHGYWYYRVQLSGSRSEPVIAREKDLKRG